MDNKIRIIIADDNKYICDLIKRHLEKYEEIEILGIATTDEEEVRMIEKFKPEIVITDLLRNLEYTGLDIIKKYYKRENAPKFLVISAASKKEVITDGLEVAGYIQKEFNLDYDKIFRELKRIKAEDV